MPSLPAVPLDFVDSCRWDGSQKFGTKLCFHRSNVEDPQCHRRQSGTKLCFNRMTSTPKHQEVLTSSLEAFCKCDSGHFSRIVSQIKPCFYSPDLVLQRFARKGLSRQGPSASHKMTI